MYLYFFKDRVLSQQGVARLTPAQLEQVGVFVALASVQGLEVAVLSEPKRAALVFDLLPTYWVEAAGISREQFDHCYFQRTGKHRAGQRLEDTVGKDLTDKVLAPERKLDGRQGEQPLQDFKEIINKSLREDTGMVHGPPPSGRATSTMYYYADAANQTRGPLSLQDLLDLRSKAVIGDTAYVIEVGAPDWRLFSSVLPPPIPPAPSPPPTASSKLAQNYVRNVCPHCQGEYEFLREEMGRESNCPHCNAPVTLQPGESSSSDRGGVEACLSRAQSGDAAAQCELGFYYYTGQSVPKDYGEAAKWFFSAAQQGHAVAQCNLGLCRAFGRGIPQSYPEGIKWFTKAAEQGDVDAAAALGLCYYGALGVGRDDNAAVKWLLHAAQQGSAQAQRSLGICYTYGTGVRKSLEEAFEWTRRAAEQGLVTAQTMLGACYTRGQGVPRNDSEGVKWLRKAAEQGDRSAQTMLGGCCLRGDGVTKDQQQAAKWFRSAAEQGYAPAQCALGGAYYRGEGVAQDNDEAVEWLSRAAQQGFAAAQAELASCYMMGCGVQSDFAEAYKWLSLAAAQGDPGAKFQCAATSIPSNLTAEGRRRAAAFVPKKENPVDEVERDLPRVRQA